MAILFINSYFSGPCSALHLILPQIYGPGHLKRTWVACLAARTRLKTPERLKLIFHRSP
jgi:hypothetical protein